MFNDKPYVQHLTAGAESRVQTYTEAVSRLPLEPIGDRRSQRSPWGLKLREFEGKISGASFAAQNAREAYEDGFDMRVTLPRLSKGRLRRRTVSD